MQRSLLLVTMLGAAAGGPYIVSNGTDVWRTHADGQAAQEASATATAGDLLPPEVPPPSGPGSILYESYAPLEGLPHHALSEVLRMDVTKEWVYQRWARKSTGLGDPDLFGVRVPLVTGVGMSDLAGSLTYYFDANGVVQRLTFHGRTADTSQLVTLLTSHFGLVRETGPVAGEQVYRRRWNNRVQSEMRSKPSPVLWATSPHESFDIDMEINRPESPWYADEHQPKLELPPPPPEPSAEEAAAAKDGKSAAEQRAEHGWAPQFRWPD